jgi:hypothetical protein
VSAQELHELAAALEALRQATSSLYRAGGERLDYLAREGLAHQIAAAHGDAMAAIQHVHQALDLVKGAAARESNS